MAGLVSAEGLSKSYKRYRRTRDRLVEWLSRERIVRHELEPALTDVTFAIEAGEAVGIIGMNGAGKSTLLRLLTRTSTPTAGRFRVEGRVAALLELGIGIHPDFTGWQNARLSCQLLGLDVKQVEAALPWIREFSELGDHLDQPVRTYSTGMQVRLAFSAATAVRPDVLIVDEALSVGDAFFQHRSMSRIREMRDEGTTVLFVTHDPAAVKALCDRVLLLDRGRLLRDGRPNEVYDYYNALIAAKEKTTEISQERGTDGEVVTRAGSRAAEIEKVTLLDAAGRKAHYFAVGSVARIEVCLRLHEEMPLPTVGFALRDRLGNDIFGSNTHYLELGAPPAASGDSFVVTFETQLNLGPGSYSASVALHSGAAHIDESYDWWDRALVFEVAPGEERSFHGLASLPIRVEMERK